MKFELKTAWKYLRARRKSLARLTAAVAVVGIAVGVASLIISQALAHGFADEMQSKILANTAHISIFTSDGAEINNWREIESSLQNIANISEIAPTAYDNVLIVGQAETGYAVIKVRSPKSEVQSSESEVAEIKGSEISVGARLAEKLQLEIGDSAEILTTEKQTPSRVRVAGTFQTGLYDYDSTWVFVSPENYALLHGQSTFTPTILSVSVKDIFRADETAREIRQILGDNFRVLDWQEANRPLFAALSLERKVSLSIISLIVFVAVLNITTTLALLVNERKPDIAILRTCGARSKNLMLIFLFEGAALGLAGIFFGTIIGLAACAAGNYFQVINLSAEVYALDHIPFAPHLTDILLIISITFALCLLAAVYPAYRAARVKPLENLRNR